MNISLVDFSKKEKKTVILAVTIGNLLEWYEIYLYIYWAPILSKLFFNSTSSTEDLVRTYLIFALGFLSRPLGGIFFGRLGDRIGRKKSLIASILMMTVPTFITGLLPTYEQIGSAAPVILCIMRVLQSFPAGGELPGAFCYLYESGHQKIRRYMTSWAAMGYQVGVIISTIECFALEHFLSYQDLVNWGWRFSFLVGGVLGILGLLLRYRLHETPVYKEMIYHVKVVKEPLFQVLNKYKKGICIGFFYCAINSSTFYLLSVNFPAYLGKIIDIDYSYNLVFTAIILLISTIPLPFFGRMGDKYNNKSMLITSVLGMMLLIYPICFAIEQASLAILIPCLVVFTLCFTCTSSLVPYIMADLFPAHVRFTCVGLSFNLIDATIGGFTPVVALQLLHSTGNPCSFSYILVFCALLSLTAYIFMKDRHPPGE